MGRGAWAERSSDCTGDTRGRPAGRSAAFRRAGESVGRKRRAGFDPVFGYRGGLRLPVNSAQRFSSGPSTIGLIDVPDVCASQVCTEYG